MYRELPRLLSEISARGLHASNPFPPAFCTRMPSVIVIATVAVTVTMLWMLVRVTLSLAREYFRWKIVKWKILCVVEGQKASIALPDCTGYRTP